MNGPEIHVGDSVLLAEDNEAPLQWKTGRVIEIYSGNDDITRVCKLKTASSTLIRPVVKLRKLPISSESATTPATTAGVEYVSV